MRRFNSGRTFKTSHNYTYFLSLMCLLCSSYHCTVWNWSFALDMVPTHFSEAFGSGKVAAWEHPLKSYQTTIKTTPNIFARKQYILAGQSFFNWMICESDQGLPSEEFPESRVGGFLDHWVWIMNDSTSRWSIERYKYCDLKGLSSRWCICYVTCIISYSCFFIQSQGFLPRSWKYPSQW